MTANRRMAVVIDNGTRDLVNQAIKPYWRMFL
jgi:hypothetical protein